MKLIGLIGGLTWISTLDYYRKINEQVASSLGGNHSAKLLLHSVDFEEFGRLVTESRWAEISTMLGKIAQGLETAGAEALVVCANTPHIAAGELQKKIGIPLIHIAEATAAEIIRQGVTAVGLIGTKPTMERDFFTAKLTEKNIRVLVPGLQEREYMHAATFNEFPKGQFLDSTKKKFLEIIGGLIRCGAEGIILGCTEFPLFIRKQDVSVPLFDTLAIHAKAAADFSLNE